MSFSDNKDNKHAMSFSGDEDSVVDKNIVFTSMRKKTKVVENDDGDVEGVRESVIDKKICYVFLGWWG